MSIFKKRCMDVFTQIESTMVFILFSLLLTCELTVVNDRVEKNASGEGPDCCGEVSCSYGQ